MRPRSSFTIEGTLRASPQAVMSPMNSIVVPRDLGLGISSMFFRRCLCTLHDSSVGLRRHGDFSLKVGYDFSSRYSYYILRHPRRKMRSHQSTSPASSATQARFLRVADRDIYTTPLPREWSNRQPHVHSGPSSRTSLRVRQWI